jgi:formiminotetrahydrofolate cyclodeaminase
VSVATETVEGLLARIAGAGPEAGGGAAAALTAATAAALVAMVSGIATRYAPEESGPREIAGEAEALRQRLIALIGLDVSAYRRVLEARRDTTESRAVAVRDALVGATEVPLEVATASARLLEHCVALLAPARPGTRSDLRVAGLLAAAALDAAALTARTNLQALEAHPFVVDAGAQLDRLLQHGGALRARLSQSLEGRYERSHA